MKKYLKSLFMVFALVVVLGIGVKLTTTTSQAASQFVALDFAQSNIKKVGDYYFKTNSNFQNIYISTAKSGPYKKTNMAPGSAFTDGKTCYYMNDGSVLYKYTVSSNKYTKLKTYNKGDYYWFHVSAVYNGVVYLTKSDFYNWAHHTYAYNISEKTTTKVKTKCGVELSKGAYAVYTPDFRTDVSPYKVVLAKLGKTSITTKKTLASAGMSLDVVGNYFYYVKYPHVTYGDGYSYNDTSQAILYRIKYDGSTAPEKLGTFKISYGEVYITKVTSTYCEYIKMDYNAGESKYYKYVYATKKTTRIG